MIQHLTPEAKVQVLAEWQAAKDGPRGAGGSGFPDDAIIPLCDQLNGLDGICTLQSCSGHPRTRTQRWASPGQLHVWLDEWCFVRFLLVADDIARMPLIDDVCVLFGRWDDARAVVSIFFLGADKGAHVLARAIQDIYLLFSVLSRGNDESAG